MAVLTIAAVQATYALMDRDATIDRVEVLTAGAAEQGAQLVVFPEENGPWIEPGNTRERRARRCTARRTAA